MTIDAIAPPKVLDYYQSIVSRLAGQSSSTKGWAVSVAMALIGFAAKDGPCALALLALVPLAVFWVLDSYYLAAEREFRKRYNDAATTAEPTLVIDGAKVSMKELGSAMFTMVNAGAYIALAVVAIGIATLISYGVIVPGMAHASAAGSI